MWLIIKKGRDKIQTSLLQHPFPSLTMTQRRLVVTEHINPEAPIRNRLRLSDMSGDGTVAMVAGHATQDVLLERYQPRFERVSTNQTREQEAPAT